MTLKLFNFSFLVGDANDFVSNGQKWTKIVGGRISAQVVSSSLSPSQTTESSYSFPDAGEKSIPMHNTIQ